MYTGNEIMVQKMDNYLEISRENNKACPGSTVILYFSRYTMLNLSMGGGGDNLKNKDKTYASI